MAGHQAVQRARPAVGAARQHGGGGPPSRRLLGEGRAAGAHRSAAVAVSAGEESSPLGYWVSSPDVDFCGTSDEVSVIRSPRAVISRQPGPGRCPRCGSRGRRRALRGQRRGEPALHAQGVAVRPARAAGSARLAPDGERDRCAADGDACCPAPRSRTAARPSAASRRASPDARGFGLGRGDLRQVLDVVDAAAARGRRRVRRSG